MVERREQGGGAVSVHEVDYERQDVRYRPILYTMIGLAVLVLAAVLIIQIMSVWLEQRDGVQRPAPTMPQPVVAPRELDLVRQREAERLDHYQRTAEEGVVRIPLERAKQLVLEEGMPVLEPAAVDDRPTAAEPPLNDRENDLELETPVPLPEEERSGNDAAMP